MKKNTNFKTLSDKELSFINDPKILIPDQILTKEMDSENITNNSKKKKI